MLISGIDKHVVDLFGREIRHSSILKFEDQGKEDVEVPFATFKSIVVEVLTQPMEIDRGKDFKHFMDLYNVAKKISEATDSVEITIEEAAIIKSRVTMSSHMIVVKAHIYNCLEGK